MQNKKNKNKKKTKEEMQKEKPNKKKKEEEETEKKWKKKRKKKDAKGQRKKEAGGMIKMVNLQDDYISKSPNFICFKTWSYFSYKRPSMQLFRFCNLRVKKWQ